MRRNCTSKINGKKKDINTGVIRKNNIVVSNGGIGSYTDPCPLTGNPVSGFKSLSVANSGNGFIRKK